VIRFILYYEENRYIGLTPGKIGIFVVHSDTWHSHPTNLYTRTFFNSFLLRLLGLYSDCSDFTRTKTARTQTSLGLARTSSD
jgi:hypothetical protein